ncbi:transposase [Planktothrix serta PCC 8927]|uniref:Transposase n=1 Tax=Planktothrix serta PCC 8927 TaxID=671068 RepID=A0A7Z9E569_9CYAN|nr:RNA-guided endonuclease TnpB family protein [Planktothrix serta]VXD23991.1 transposase [Planktothrix serta PCC 8927]
MLKATKVRLYPTAEQELALAKSFGCARWYWNFALNACIQHYQETGKSLKLASYKGMLPQLKKEYPWLKEDCYSSVLQCVAINLDRAYKNFFEGRAKFPNFKSKHHKQSIQYPQSVTVNGEYLKVPKIGEIKAIFHREITGKIKTVTISKTSTDKYFASILCEVEGTDVKQSGDNIIGIDLGLKDFAIVHDGDSATKYANPQDFLHKLARELVNESQVIVVENLNVKGMVKNRKLSKAISDVGWGKFVNFIDYKLKQKNGELVEIDRFFPSSKTCSSCGHVLDELSLDIREWACPNCHTHHDRDINAALNIRNEGIRILTEGGGNPVFADGGCVSPPACKSKGHRSVNSEAYTDPIRAV